MTFRLLFKSYQAVLTRWLSMFIYMPFLFVFFPVIVDAREYKTYLSYSVYNNNRIMDGEFENQRLINTTRDYKQRLSRALKGKKACDPRTVVKPSPYPNNKKTKPKKCTSHHYPAPTNQQFRTRWNPETHKFHPDFILSDKALKRDIKLNLKFVGKGAFLRKNGFLCDWIIEKPNNSKLVRNNVDCKEFNTQIFANKKYFAKITVKEHQKIIHVTERLSFKIRDFLIVGLGDSFGSGEGNPHTYFPLRDHSIRNKPSMWLDPRCHRSLFSSSIQATTLLAQDYWNYSFSVANLACSGAESNTGLLHAYTGRSSASQIARLWTAGNTTAAPTKVHEGFMGYKSGSGLGIGNIKKSNSRKNPSPADIPSQLDQLIAALGCNSNHVCKRQPDAILVYIGVNDIGFSDRLISIILDCANRVKCKKDAIEAVKKGLNTVEKNISIFAKKMGDAGIRPPGGNSSIFIVTYPNTLTKRKRKLYPREIRSGNYKGGYLLCGERDKAFGKNIEKAAFLGGFARLFGFGINKLGSEFARDKILFPLNEMLKRAAADQKWSVIDNHQAMLGRGFCTKDRMVNNFFESQNKQGNVPPAYSWEDYTCRDSNNLDCKIIKSVGIPSGPMHPNYWGHRDVASRTIPPLIKLFKLQKPK
ncbi:MAG: hypothetical protein V3V04_04925 [Rhizobiaceae bacterium]